ncbi:MAG TPA: hypothetical protein PLQ54_00395 [Armatimonadota bacterium]|nr:hypothetical protein [Armatimonadota bacterium]
MRRRFVSVLVFASATLSAQLAAAQPPGAPEVAQPVTLVAHEDFEDPAALARWSSLDPEAAVRLTNAPGAVHGGQSALEFTYTPRETVFPMVVGQGMGLAGARSLSFALMAAERTPLLYGVFEADGSMYSSFLDVPPGVWGEIRVSLGDLQLADESEDENAALDSDQVDRVFFADLSNLQGEMGRALGWKTSPQTLLIDDVALSAEAVPSRWQAAPDAGAIRFALAPGRIDALAIGGAQLAVVPVDGRPALQITYRIGGWRWAGFVTGLGSLPSADVAGVSFRARVSADARVNVLLEERDRSRYASGADLVAGQGWQNVELPLAAFSLDEFSADENGRLDPDQLRVLVLITDTFTAAVDDQGKGEILVDSLALHLGHGGR